MRWWGCSVGASQPPRDIISLNPDGRPRELVLGLSPLCREQDGEAREWNHLPRDVTAKSWQVLDLGV